MPDGAHKRESVLLYHGGGTLAPPLLMQQCLPCHPARLGAMCQRTSRYLPFRVKRVGGNQSAWPMTHHPRGLLAPAPKLPPFEGVTANTLTRLGPVWWLRCSRSCLRPLCHTVTPSGLAGCLSLIRLQLPFIAAAPLLMKTLTPRLGLDRTCTSSRAPSKLRS